MVTFTEVDNIPDPDDRRVAKQGRPKKNTVRGERFWFSLAKMISKKSDCPRKQVGAIIVANEEAVAQGYNHHKYGTGTCVVEDNSCKNAIHAELDALSYLMSMDRIPKFVDMYCTLEPCPSCKKAIPSWVKVHYEESYNDYLNSKAIS